MVRFILASLFALAFVATLVSVPHASAQTAGNTAKDSSNLLKSLQELGYRHRVDSDGWTVVEVPGENGGSTHVHISPLQNIQGELKHVVVIPVCTFRGDLPEKVVELLKRINSEMPVGFLKLNEHNGTYYLSVTVLVRMGDDKFEAKGLANVLRVCAKAGREVESALKRTMGA